MPKSTSSVAASHIGLYRSGLTNAEHRRHITVGRGALVDDALDILRKGAGRKPNHHLLFIGPRGVGKTHLLSLLEDEIGRDLKLKEAYKVIRFPEESNRTLSFADFLLGLCEILRDILPYEVNWAELHRKLETQENDAPIIDTLVPALRKRYRDTRQVLIVMLENLHQIFDEQIKFPRSIAALRGFFMDDNGCLLIATAPLHFGAITDQKQPFYDFFDVQILDPLTDQESIDLIRRNLEWEKRNDLLADFANLRPKLFAIFRMTGGNPRLTLMLYELITRENIVDVKRQFALLLDGMTPFYQDRMSDLPPQERALLETLSVMRDIPKTPNAIAQRMRMKQPQVSSLLGRLTKAQYVRSVENPNDKRSRFYMIRDGFLDIWLAMNVSRGARKRLPFLLDFFAEYYPNIEASHGRQQKLSEIARLGLRDPKPSGLARDGVVDPEWNRPTVRESDAVESLEYFSEVDDPKERTPEKIHHAMLHLEKGDAKNASDDWDEARMRSNDPTSRVDAGPPVDHLADVEEMIAAWEIKRDGRLEAFAEKLYEIGARPIP